MSRSMDNILKVIGCMHHIADMILQDLRRESTYFMIGFFTQVTHKRIKIQLRVNNYPQEVLPPLKILHVSLRYLSINCFPRKTT